MEETERCRDRIMVNVAAAQINVVKDIDKNLLKILAFIEQAKSKDVEIVCFPETCLNSREENIVEVSKHIGKIQEKCKEKSIWCIVGSYVPQNNKMRNVTFLIDRLGKIRYEYVKVHLWKTEKENVIAGKTNNVIDTEFGKIGIITCWDFAFPSFIQQLSQKGAKIIFCPSYLVSYKKDGDVLRKIPLVRAFENLVFYISCDAFTDETLSESFLCHPLRIVQKIEKREGIIYADLDLEEIDSLRNYYDHRE